ncbi:MULTISPECIES: IS1096 element passenger TnpR family protein [unclassified Carboxylicivirga]|uniref:IS1096 element passenger TnpR family protein n=1 Tax=Carboxylicivirga TaxID=1628153 RepID=UPI003D35578C
MIIYLRVLSNEVESFVEEIAIDDTASFADLHTCIQHTNDYDATQMASFFTTDNEWNKETEITLFDMSEGANESLKVMQDTLISDFLFEEGQRLLYVFDFFSERAFFMEVIEMAEGTLKKANCYRNEGEAPEQIKMADLSDDTGMADEDLFGDEFDGSLDSMNFEDLDTDLNLDDYADQY